MKFRLLTKILFIFVVLLASVFAANYANTIVMNKNNFDVQLYNCKSDSTCSNPSLVSEDHTDSSKYTFNYFTDDYYAEYLFKEGYIAKGFIVHKYSRTNNFNFDKKQNCQANINSVVVSNQDPVQGDLVSVNVNVKSAFGNPDPGTPLYRPNKYKDWFDAKTGVMLQVLQNGNVIQQSVQMWDIYMNTNYNFNFQIDTSNLASGLYTIKVITNVVDDICNQNNDLIKESTTSLNVRPGTSQLPVAVAGPDRAVCLDQNVVFDGSSSYDPDGTIVFYSWYFDDGGGSNDQIANHIFSSVGSYNVILTVIDNDNLISQDNLVVTVDYCNNTLPPVANFTFSPVNPVSGQIVTFDGSSSYDPDGSIVGYEWDFNGDLVSDAIGSVVNHIFSTNGTYMVTLSVVDNLGFGDLETKQIVVGSGGTSYTLELEISADPEEGEAPLEVEFDSTVTGHGPFTYFWDFDDGTNSTQADPDHEFDDEGTYNVELTVRDDHGNQETEDVTIRVYDEDDDIDSHENDIHRLSIGHVELDNETIIVGDEIRLDAELINNGDFRESNVILTMSIPELGISISSSALTLSPGSTDWESLELEIPEDVVQGLYNLKIELRNSNYIDTEYKTLTLLEKNTSDALLSDVTEKENKLLFVLEIVFASLLILALIIGIVLLIREIRRITQR